MSASAANVPSGLTKQITAEARNSTPNIAETQRVDPSPEVRAKLWMAAKANMNPRRTPTVVTDAVSNCRITSEMTSQAIPLASESHQYPVISRVAPRSP